MTNPFLGPTCFRGPRVQTLASRCYAQLSGRYPVIAAIALAMLTTLVTAPIASGQGEPAEEFLKRLRAAGYFDTAITYLSRLDEYPGVDAKITNAIQLEKAQTFIDAAIATRNSKKRDELFRNAEQELSEFLKAESHPRESEARLQLGKLQMVRAAQLMTGQPDQIKRDVARQSYLAAASTFDQIIEGLKGKLQEMQGAKIDPAKDPEAAALRDQYRGEYLQALGSAGQSRFYAAQTFDSPAEDGKELLETALASFMDLSEKYPKYVQGALAMLYRGQVQEDLGQTEPARDSYLRMLEQPDADPLRDGKYQAMVGLIRISMADTPPKYEISITRGKPMLEGIRPNEKALPSVQDLRIELAKAYLAKSASSDDKLKAAEKKRAESSGRQLLIQASKLPGDQAETANSLLANMGIDLNQTADLPTVEDPASLEDALTAARELLSTSESLAQSLQVLENQTEKSAEMVDQIKEIKTQLDETRIIAIQTLRRGLSMVTLNADMELVHQTRHFLSYLLYQEKRYRESAVVGTFLARKAPATELGLRGGLLALNSLQLLMAEQPDNTQISSHLESLGQFLSQTWPNNPDAAAAQGVMIRLALRDDRWDEARKTIEAMAKGREQGSFYRLMGQLQWNEYIQAKQAGNDAEAAKYLSQAQADLKQGLEQINGKLVDPAAMRAALVLTKTYIKQGDVNAAAAVLNQESYGPLPLMEAQGSPDERFAGDLYATELQVIVGLMSADAGDPKGLLERAVNTMEKLRQSVQGDNGEKRLTDIYIGLARDIREQLSSASPAKKARLISAFRLLLDRVAATTQNPATLRWVGQTLIDLGETSMAANQIKAEGQAAELLQTAADTFVRLKSLDPDSPLAVDYLLGKSYRLIGEYKKAVDVFKDLLSKKPSMLDAQIQAALCYEYWAAEVPPKYTGKWYEFALSGAKQGANKQNIIWGWGKISQQTSRNPKYRAIFFDARYHVALCRFRWGSAIKSNEVMKKSASDITKVHALYPELGGPEQKAKFNLLLKLIQKKLGLKVEGL
ncbi:MAG: hypothetical protein P8L85_03040 [Rubripirellula sp.]|nr:hypothetical protein [Rubripirellula sp.]